MSMTLPAGTVPLGEKAYLFPSPSAQAVTDCFIIAHGGLPSIRRKGISYNFKVPDGCTVYFMAKGGQPFKASGPVSGCRAIAGENGGQPPAVGSGNTRKARSLCGDYILAKALGTHAPTGGTPETMAEKNYTAVNQTLNQLAGPHAGLQWLPHYVSVRNRTSWLEDTNIFLSRLIELVRAYDATIVNFYCAHCRDNLSDDKSVKYLKTAGPQSYQ
jgi:Putative adhesin Stv domain